MGLFNMLVHAAWNLQRFRTLEAQLMTNGLDSLLDEPTAKALDRLQRYASSNQRAYFAALSEFAPSKPIASSPRLEGRDDPIPELVSVVDVMKRTESLGPPPFVPSYSPPK